MSHRKHIDDNVDLVKKQMSILNEVDKPGSDVEVYVGNLEQILSHNMNMIQEMQSKLVDFRSFLKKEATLSNLWQKYTEGQEQDVEMEAFDLDENKDQRIVPHQ